jgi:hypothetical protein
MTRKKRIRQAEINLLETRRGKWKQQRRECEKNAEAQKST